MKHEAINQPVAVPQRAQVVMAMLNGAAERGDDCPSNNLLGGAIDAAANTAGNVVALLETMGLITVKRFIRARVVTIVSTGKSTRRHVGREIKFLANRGRRTPPPWHNDETMETFADELAEGRSVKEAGRIAGCNEADARAMFQRICANLGAQAA